MYQDVKHEKEAGRISPSPSREGVGMGENRGQSHSQSLACHLPLTTENTEAAGSMHLITPL